MNLIRKGVIFQCNTLQYFYFCQWFALKRSRHVSIIFSFSIRQFWLIPIVRWYVMNKYTQTMHITTESDSFYRSEGANCFEQHFDKIVQKDPFEFVKKAKQLLCRVGCSCTSVVYSSCTFLNFNKSSTSSFLVHIYFYKWYNEDIL